MKQQTLFQFTERGQRAKRAREQQHLSFPSQYANDSHIVYPIKTSHSCYLILHYPYQMIGHKWEEAMNLFSLLPKCHRIEAYHRGSDSENQGAILFFLDEAHIREIARHIYDTLGKSLFYYVDPAEVQSRRQIDADDYKSTLKIECRDGKRKSHVSITSLSKGMEYLNK